MFLESIKIGYLVDHRNRNKIEFKKLEFISKRLSYQTLLAFIFEQTARQLFKNKNVQSVVVFFGTNSHVVQCKQSRHMPEYVQMFLSLDSNQVSNLANDIFAHLGYMHFW